MSRPPNCNQNSYPQVVNGGLIDFQDNQMRGSCEYGLSTSGLSPGGTCITGPPSFIHVNGITYRPVDESQESSKTVPTSVAPSVKTSSVPSVSPSDSLDDEIERRVQVKVDEYLSSRAGRASARSFEGNNTEHRSSKPVEDDVARRVQRVNESMRQMQGSSRRDPFVSGRNW